MTDIIESEQELQAQLTEVRNLMNDVDHYINSNSEADDECCEGDDFEQWWREIENELATVVSRHQ